MGAVTEYQIDAMLKASTKPETPRLIGLTGLAGSGKSTGALELVAMGSFRRIRFADPLKQMLKAVGLTDAQVDGDQKEVPTDWLCGKTPRFAMQTLGTQWGRHIIGEGVWVNLALRRVQQLLDGGLSVVIDDARFPDEVEAIKRLGGKVIRVDRVGAGIGATHESEAHIMTLEVDAVVGNDGTPEQLGSRILAA